MKKIIFSLIVVVAFASCQEECKPSDQQIIWGNSIATMAIEGAEIAYGMTAYEKSHFKKENGSFESFIIQNYEKKDCELNQHDVKKMQEFLKKLRNFKPLTSCEEIRAAREERTKFRFPTRGLLPLTEEERSYWDDLEKKICN